MAVQITAALAVKELMEREGLPGTIQIWPGVAEELVATKAYYVRAGMFEDVDIVLYAHVGSNLSTGWGMTPGTNRAQGEATRFEAIYAEYRKAPRVTRNRMYLETMNEILPRMGRKVILDEKQRGLLPLLNLAQEVQK